MKIKQEGNGNIYGETKQGAVIFKFEDGYISIRHKDWEDHEPSLVIHEEDIEELPPNKY